MAGNATAAAKLASTLIVSAVARSSAFAQAAPGRAECRNRMNGMAMVTRAAPTSVGDGWFVVRKNEGAVLEGECGRFPSSRPEPEPFAETLSPNDPGLAIRATGAAFAIEPAEARQAVADCMTSSVHHPPRHLDRAGFARQRWRASQMIGPVLMPHLNGDGT